MSGRVRVLTDLLWPSALCCTAQHGKAWKKIQQFINNIVEYIHMSVCGKIFLPRWHFEVQSGCTTTKYTVKISQAAAVPNRLVDL